MRTRVIVITLCVCVCVSVCLSICPAFAAFKSTLYIKMDLPACFSSVFLGFQLTHLSKVPLFPRKSAFHGYFVVPIHICINSSVRILLVVEQSRGARSFYIEHTLMQVMSFFSGWFIALGSLALLVDIDLYLRSKCMLSCRYIVSQLYQNYS